MHPATMLQLYSVLYSRINYGRTHRAFCLLSECPMTRYPLATHSSCQVTEIMIGSSNGFSRDAPAVIVLLSRSGPNLVAMAPIDTSSASGPAVSAWVVKTKFGNAPLGQLCMRKECHTDQRQQANISNTHRICKSTGQRCTATRHARVALLQVWRHHRLPRLDPH